VNASYTQTQGQGNGGSKFSETGFGIRAPITPRITVGVQDTLVNNAQATNMNANVVGAVAEYAFSKRTTAYVLGALSSNQSASQTNMVSTSKFSSSAQVGAAGLNQTGYMIGMRHTF
jgi:predicted porin